MHLKHLAQLVALSALWGASFIMNRIASPQLGPEVLALFRTLIATATLALLLRVNGMRWPRGHWRELAGLGLLSVAIPFVLFAWAALTLPAGYSALFNSTAALFGLLAAVWLGEDRLTPRKLAGCAVGLVGVGLTVGLGPVAPSVRVVLACLACIVASAMYGLSSPLMKRALARMQPLQSAAGLYLTSSLMLAPFAAPALPQAHFTPLALLLVTVLGVVTSGLAYWLHLRILIHVTPVAAMSPTFMIPVFGVAWAHLLLDEPLGPGIWLGGALVLLASALVTGFQPWRKRLEEIDAKP